MERGLHFDLEVEESSKEMRKMLNLWICISTQHKGGTHHYDKSMVKGLLFCRVSYTTPGLLACSTV